MEFASNMLEDFSKIVTHLKNEELIAYPTETLWGLGADIESESALEKLFQLKQRQDSKAISVLVEDIMQAKQLAHIDRDIEMLLYFFWPGPLTAVLPAKEHVSQRITAGGGKVGLRCTPHTKTRELLQAFGGPITTTSANLSGQPAALKPADLDWLPNDALVVSDEELPASQGSTVIGIEGSRIKVFREGDLSVSELQKVAAGFGFVL